MAFQFFIPSANVTSGGGDAVYVATVPLRATGGPPQLIMSMAYSLNIWNLQHFMVLIKPSSSIPQEVSSLFFFFFVDYKVFCINASQRKLMWGISR